MAQRMKYNNGIEDWEVNDNKELGYPYRN